MDPITYHRNQAVLSLVAVWDQADNEIDAARHEGRDWKVFEQLASRAMLGLAEIARTNGENN